MYKLIKKIRVACFALYFLISPSYAQNIQNSQRELPARASLCQDCHTIKNREFISPKKQPYLEHSSIHLKHGKAEIACGSCHDRNNSNFLRSTVEASASFKNSSPVCMQCHINRYKDWQNGIHGKRIGGWNLDKIQSQCIDCHNPHSVKFYIMKASPAPKKPKLGITKKENE